MVWLGLITDALLSLTDFIIVKHPTQNLSCTTWLFFSLTIAKVLKRVELFTKGSPHVIKRSIVRRFLSFFLNSKSFVNVANVFVDPDPISMEMESERVTKK